jgi:predicted secreted hydrolase
MLDAMAREPPAEPTRKRRLAIAVVAAVLILAAVAFVVTMPAGNRGPDIPGGVDRTITFPRDEGRHDDPVEVWAAYLLVKGSGGQAFGLTVQYGVGEDKTIANRLLSLTDEDGFSGRVFRWNQSLNVAFTASRDRLNLSFGEGGWADTWEATAQSPATYSIHLVSSEVGSEDRIVLDAVLTSLKAPVLLGDAGKVYLEEQGTMFSYVQTRLSVSGTLVIGGNSTAITGSAWIEHKWGDWRVQEMEYLRLQLSGQEELLFLRLHYENPSATWETLLQVRSDGQVVDLTARGPSLQWQRFWRDPGDSTGRSFPVEWTLVTSDGHVGVSGTAPIVSQRAFFWEGTVDLGGTLSGLPVAGRGYALMMNDYRSNIAVQSVQHFPDPEIPTDPSTVVATVASGVPVANVTLSYQLTKPDASVTFGNVTMVLEGSVWRGQLPSAPLNSVFEFTVIATDLAGTRAESETQSWTVTV